MENKKTTPVLSSVLGIIIGVALYKQFDFETLSFEKPRLALVYVLGLGILAYFIVKARKG